VSGDLLGVPVVGGVVEENKDECGSFVGERVGRLGWVALRWGPSRSKDALRMTEFLVGRTKNRQRRNAGVPPLRFAPVGMTEAGGFRSGRDDGGLRLRGWRLLGRLKTE
jgi:hypothetical protein